METLICIVMVLLVLLLIRFFKDKSNKKVDLEFYENTSKRWTEDELKIVSYIAIYYDIDDFETICNLSITLRRSYSSVFRKARRLRSILPGRIEEKDLSRLDKKIILFMYLLTPEKSSRIFLNEVYKLDQNKDNWAYNLLRSH